jgi:glycosyltransferase involved in cell wall biosynthesis
MGGRLMRILITHPGANYSTGDVFTGYVDALKKLGHEIIIYDLAGRMVQADHYLDYVWRQARKKNEAIPRPTMADAVRWASMTLLEAALSTLPDWCLIFSGIYMHQDAMVCLYRSGCPIGIILTESPYDDAKQGGWAAFSDVVFTHERASVPILSRERYVDDDPKQARIWGNKNTHYLPHAYDPVRHNPAARMGSGFSERQEMLARIDWQGMGIDLGIYGQWPYLGSRSPLRKYKRGGVTPNGYTAALYRKAKVGLNLYRQSMGQTRNAPRMKGAESLNPRALELAAIGVPHVSDFRPEVQEVFGDTVPTFTDDDPVDMAEQILKLLEDDRRRETIRAALPGRVAGWTFDDRAKQLMEALNATRRPT